MYLRQTEICDLYSWLAEHGHKQHPEEEDLAVGLRKEEDENHEIVFGNCVLCGEEFTLSVDGCGRIEDYATKTVRENYTSRRQP